MKTYTIKKFERTGNGLKERLHIKAFKNYNDMGAFLCQQSDNRWQEITEAHNYPTKSGIYVFAGGQWHNVKTLDASVLAHV